MICRFFHVLAAAATVVLAACANDTTHPGFTVDVVLIPEHGGTVEGEGRYPPNTSVVLTVRPNAGFIFGGWGFAKDNGLVFSTDPKITIVDSADVSVRAYFAEIRQPLVMQPGAYQLAGDSVIIAAILPNPRFARSIRASAGTAPAPLAYPTVNSRWEATLRLVGQPLDTLPVTIAFTDSAERTRDERRLFRNPPR